MGKKRICVLTLLVTFIMIFTNVFAQKTTEEAYSKGVEYGRQGKYDEAISEFSKAIEINPNLAKAYNDRGLSYFYKILVEEACKNVYSAYKKVVENSPDYTVYQNTPSQNYSKKEHQGNYEQAISDLNKAIEINPELAEAYNNRALIYYKQGNYNKAWEDVHKAESLGYKVNPEFIEKLKKTSGREK